MPGFIISLIVSIVTMPIIMLISRKYNIVDRPNNRKFHTVPTPLLGGLGIYIAFTLAMLIHLEYTHDILRLILYSLVVLIFGITDDLKDIKAIYKLIIELVLCLLMVLGGMRLYINKVLNFPGFLLVLEILLSLIWMVGITNAINILDGLDGLAGGVSLIACAAFTVIFIIEGYNLELQLTLILIGGILGFLIYNFHPSKLFMGDGGSLFLGFILAILSIMYTQKKGMTYSLMVPMVILAIPIFDMGHTTLRRLIKGRNIMASDDSHIHYRLIQKGYSPAKAVILILGFAVLFGGIGILMALYNLLYLGPIIIFLLVGIGIRLNI